MIKNIQTKIILIFFVLGSIVISFLSIFHITILERINKLLTKKVSKI